MEKADLTEIVTKERINHVEKLSTVEMIQAENLSDKQQEGSSMLIELEQAENVLTAKGGQSDLAKLPSTKIATHEEGDIGVRYELDIGVLVW